MKCVSLYPVYGSRDLGFGEASFETIWASDIDPIAGILAERVEKMACHAGGFLRGCFKSGSLCQRFG